MVLLIGPLLLYFHHFRTLTYSHRTSTIKPKCWLVYIILSANNDLILIIHIFLSLVFYSLSICMFLVNFFNFYAIFITFCFHSFSIETFSSSSFLIHFFFFAALIETNAAAQRFYLVGHVFYAAVPT